MSYSHRESTTSSSILGSIFDLIASFGIFALGLLAVILVVAGFVISGAYIGRSVMIDQAIERGYAEYCPTTGDPAWIGECDKTDE